MPSKPRHRCNKCGEIVSGVCRCTATKQFKQRDTRESAAKRGYGYRWQKFREYFLRHNGVCNDCGIRAATDVHHIIKVRDDSNEQYSEDNCIALCHECHAKRTRRGE